MPLGVTYVVIISVENYHEKQDFPKVEFAKKDADDLIKAFTLLGYHEDDFVVLTDERATRTAILQKVKSISEKALKNDRIIFYFSGHGFYEGGDNYLGPVDAVKTSVPDTCVSINIILGLFKKSASTQKILFLDCCHSGFESGELLRDNDDSFMADELIYQFSKEEFCVGFSSCKTSQKSISHPKLKNGVWSHFLIKALSGDAGGIYTQGLLFSDKLQNYLAKQTSEFVKINTTSKRDQTPIKFGSETDRFIIADINPIFDERIRIREVSDLSFINISFINEESGAIQNLPGFQRKFHKVPTFVGTAPNNFIKDKGRMLVEQEIINVSKKLKDELGYKRSEIRSNPDMGSIETPDFDYNVSIIQSSTHPGMYIISRSLENFKSSEIALRPEFNGVFSNYFKTLLFELTTKIDVEGLIDTIESLGKDSIINVDYSPSDTSSCSIEIAGVDNQIVVTETSMKILSNFGTSPDKLITAFKKTHKAILLNPSLKLLR